MTSRTCASSWPLGFSAGAPEGTQSEPGEGRGEAGGDGEASGADLAGMILAVFLDRTGGEAERHHQENQSGDFEPKLVRDACEGSRGGAHRAKGRAGPAIAAGFLLGDAGEGSEFLP